MSEKASISSSKIGEAPKEEACLIGEVEACS
jgi:hypothetical protein